MLSWLLRSHWSEFTGIRRTQWYMFQLLYCPRPTVTQSSPIQFVVSIFGAVQRGLSSICPRKLHPPLINLWTVSLCFTPPWMKITRHLQRSTEWKMFGIQNHRWKNPEREGFGFFSAVCIKYPVDGKKVSRADPGETGRCRGASVRVCVCVSECCNSTTYDWENGLTTIILAPPTLTMSTHRSRSTEIKEKLPSEGEGANSKIHHVPENFPVESKG